MPTSKNSGTEHMPLSHNASDIKYGSSVDWKEELTDSGLVLLHHEFKPQINGVVDCDLSILVCKHHATKGSSIKSFAINGEIALLICASLALDELAILSCSSRQDSLNHRFISRPALDNNLV